MTSVYSIEIMLLMFVGYMLTGLLVLFIDEKFLYKKRVQENYPKQLFTYAIAVTIVRGIAMSGVELYLTVLIAWAGIYTSYFVQKYVVDRI